MAERLKDFAEAQAKTHGIQADDDVALRGDLHMNMGANIIKAAKEAACDLNVMASHVPGEKESHLVF